MKNIYIISSYQPKVDRLEEMFKQKVNLEHGIIFTKVPRGLIMSFDERIFFEVGQDELKENSYLILNLIAEQLKKISNDCVIEDHTEDKIPENSDYQYDWELSITRAGNIAQYLIDCGKLNSRRIFALGFGEIMPFKENVARTSKMDSRIDIVILEYETER
ncbi:MAG: OmpA family protein [Candidatus Gastranaerophilales bacterium]